MAVRPRHRSQAYDSMIGGLVPAIEAVTPPLDQGRESHALGPRNSWGVWLGHRDGPGGKPRCRQRPLVRAEASMLRKGRL